MAAACYVYYRSLRSTEFKWTASGSGTGEFYLELAAGGDPASLVKSEPPVVYENAVAMTPGTAGSLAASEWDWADNDTLGYSTVYVRLADDSDPDGKAANYVAAGGDDSDGTTWAKAVISIEDALVLGGAEGAEIWIASDHKEEQTATSITLTFTAATYANPLRLLSVNRATNALEAGSVLMTSGTTDISMSGGRGQTWSGVTFSSGDDFTVTGTSTKTEFESCTFLMTDTQQFVGVSGRSRFVDCTFDTYDTGILAMVAGGEGSVVHFVDCVFNRSGGAPTGHFIGSMAGGEEWVFENCDLSAHTGVSLVAANTSTQGKNVVIFRRCKMPAAFNVVSGAFGDSTEVRLEGCAAGAVTVPPIGLAANMYGMEIHTYLGTVKADLSHFRTGGASDGVSAAYSWQMTCLTTAVEMYRPLRSPPIVIWAEPDSSIVGATARGLFSNSTRCALLTAPTNIEADPADPSNWNGADVGTEQMLTHTLSNGSTLTLYFASAATKQNDEVWMEVSEPDQVGGPVTVVVCLAVATGATIYIDPKLEIT